MEFTRRNFIKCAVGGLGGTLLSPLPWKLIDDIAIWTQNWSWVPVPAEGKFSTVNTVCTLCPGGCGIEVRKVGDRVVKIEGRADYPVNRGAICPLGMAGPQLLYHEGVRWKGPMKRVGPRGSLEWKEIPWSEAINLAADRIQGLREKGVPEQVGAIDGNQTGSTVSLFIKRLLNAIGNPNYMPVSGGEDTYEAAMFVMQGTKGPVTFDLENSDFILSFGCGLLDGWGAPGRVLRAWSQWATGRPHNTTYLVQVDPRLSATASKADTWIAPFPGTEGALALGLCHVIIKEKLYSKRFIEEYAFGFDDWVETGGTKHTGFANIVLQKYSPQAVEQMTGVGREVIADVARKFVTAKAPLALSGRGKGRLPGSLYEFMAVHALNALAGRINQRGGVLAAGDLPLASWPKPAYDRVALKGLSRSRIDRAGTSLYPFAESLLHKFSEAIINGTPSPIDTLLVCSANPAYTLPESRQVDRALSRIPFIISLSPFLDETSLMADLILPDHTHLEKMSDIVWPQGVQYPVYALSRPTIQPVYKTRHTGEVILSLAKKLGGTIAESFQWPHYEEALKERVKGLYDSGKGRIGPIKGDPVWKRLDTQEIGNSSYTSFDAFWDDLKEHGCWYTPFHPFDRWSEIFQTPSNKFEFFSSL
jgi:anaerobic selenocysteine-containing dehydrogenase